MKVRKAVIPAAGFGTRMLPATKAVPKEMLPILNKPCIQYIVEEAVYAGIEEILIITGRAKKAIEDHFDRSPELELHLEQSRKANMLTEVKAISDLVDIHYTRQKTPLGLGHAILCAKSFVGQEPFAVLLGDDIIQSSSPVTRQLMQHYEDAERALLGIQPVPQKDVSKYGIVESGPASAKPGVVPVQRVIEKPSADEAPSNLAVLGRYILPASIFDALEETPLGHGGELQLTDAIQQLAAKGLVDGFQFEGVRHDIGNLEGWLRANLSFGLSEPKLADAIRGWLTDDHLKNQLAAL
ncbi:UTP--glucose-1-phosphate uridylyltransferase GalU [Alicyclobacillus acidoterrestris]|uniref:UTP--glucose-1-phosphate uridylyltransferase n=1 Tax=Alicyclobacillus acidoterrestris (strain ATCC 49025 / DSM 3922 / CIP 106132 / NCIMB 13137 / GD3B) TaxID=1356854 RepID=T0BNE7_ALIAG|nr:UTP--glucose-1-phosphate uridylyltransferase GalU [Alicyclobacillus acidoterrestris]EPZ42294.1 UTP--glucose-1-phosphate uridylyltransferase [Alicyclobacillus acidoterrestris ATCC 49025]UNO48124.1 UTP--glucose-1-phosphate uridylyltransferase GalU [Alicyclobacillus acidoterrestris]